MTEFLSSVPIVPARDIEATTGCFREFSVVDVDGNLVTFFEPPSGYDPRA